MTTPQYQNPATTPSYATPSYAQPEATDVSQIRSNRGAGVILLLLLFGIFWVYGWASQITFTTATSSPVNLTNQSIFALMFVFAAVFVVIGYGLVLTYFKNSTATAFFTSIFIVSFTILLSPLIQKFWFNVFITDFKGAQVINNDPSRYLIQSMDKLQVYLDFYNLKIALVNAISQLVVFTAIYGRMNTIEVILNSFFYNIVWNLSHFLCIYLQINGPDNRIFDDYQISSVYLFAATYGIAATLLLKKPPAFDLEFNHSATSAVLSQIGSFFIFLSFCCTTTLFSLKSVKMGTVELPRTIIVMEAFLGTFFALSASVITTYAVSILVGGKIGVRESIIGTISGAVIYGAVAGTSTNIGAAIAVGIFGGAVSGLYFQVFYKKINNEHIYDSMGLIATWIVSFLGTFFISPIVLITYYNYDVKLNTLSIANITNGGNITSFATPFIPQIITNKGIAGWVLIYVGITIGIAFLSGLIVSLFVRCFQRLRQYEYSDTNIFGKGSGLKEVPERNVSHGQRYQTPGANPYSAEQLRRN